MNLYPNNLSIRGSDSMLKKLYDTSQIWFAVVWIVGYCVLMSVGDSFSTMIGMEKSVTFILGLTLSALLLLFLKRNGLLEAYGLCRPKVSSKSMLYYIPVLVMLTANSWYGLSFHYSLPETALYILTMLCVGFLEEVIFRGLLFEAMRKNGAKVAVIVSSVSFGIGHIVNLINGSGTELLPNSLQILYATAAGFMFVMIYYKTKSMLLCIISHALFNAFSVFADESNATMKMQILSAILLAVITGGYAAYIALTFDKKE